jgi:hypothetical protein
MTSGESMKVLIITAVVIFVAGVVLFALALCKAASDGDDAAEKWQNGTDHFLP